MTKKTTKDSVNYRFVVYLFAIMCYVCDDIEGEL